jgi:hypothetical protein
VNLLPSALLLLSLGNFFQMNFIYIIFNFLLTFICTKSIIVLLCAGYVVDASNAPVAGAELHFDNTSFSVRSDTNGAFRRPVAPGVHTITVSASGYFPTTVPVNVHGELETYHTEGEHPTSGGEGGETGHGAAPLVVVLQRDMRIWGVPRLTFVFAVGELPPVQRSGNTQRNVWDLSN